MSPRFLKYFILSITVFSLFSCGGDEDDPGPSPQPPTVDCSTLGVSVTSSTNASCTSLGAIELTGNGGLEPYTYALAGGAFQSSGTFEELTAGSYNVSVKDANDCSASLMVTVDEDANDLSMSANPTTSAGCGTAEGTIEVSLDSGSGDIQYSLNGGDFSADVIFTGLSADTYEITARNADGCETTTSTQVLTGISLSGDVQAIITNNCALATCHGGARFPDFRQKTNIINNATNIADRTANGSMPPSGALDQGLIDLIACWVEDGAPDN